MVVNSYPKTAAGWINWTVPILNKDLGYVWFASFISLLCFGSIWSKSIEPGAVMPVICVIVGHYFGSTRKGRAEDESEQRK